MKQLGHFIFFFLTLTWLSLLLFYQVFVNSRYQRVSLKQAVAAFDQIKYQPPVLGQPAPSPDPEIIKIDCRSVCQFIIKGQIVKTRKDSDAAGGVTALTLQFFDQEKGLIGYQDHEANPTFYVIDNQSNLLQVVRLKLDQIEFSFQAYYPQTQQILFRSDQGEQFLYAANQPSLQIL
ncbi:hypothetical protein KJ909_03675 [Patescibacteria group bacterium]|nr:hypothetical protein [Patescibacteria group bacterium]